MLYFLDKNDLRGRIVKRKAQYLKFVITYNLILLIPFLIINICALDLFKKHQYEKVIDEVQMTFERQDDFLKQQMSVIRNFSDECRFNKIYNELYWDTPNVYLDIEEDLKEQEDKIPFVDGIYLYDKQNKIVLSSVGSFSEELFFDKVCKIEKELFENVEKSGGGVTAARALLQGEKKEGILFVTSIRTWTTQGEEIKYLLFPVRNRKINSQLEQTKEDKVFLSYQDKVLYTTEDWGKEENWEKKFEKVLSDDEYYTWKSNMECGFEYTRMISKESITNSLNIYLRGYAMWVLCSLAIGVILACFFSKIRYENYRKLILHSEELEEERNELRTESCLYELLQKEVEPQDELWNKCLESKIYLNRKYKFFVVLPDNIPENKGYYEWFGQQMNKYSISTAYRIEIVEGVLIYLICTDEPARELEKKITTLATGNVQIGIGDLTTDVSKLRQSYQQAKERMNKLPGNKEKNVYPEREIISLKEAVKDNDGARAILLIDEISDYMKKMDTMMTTGILWDVSRIFGININKVLEEKENDKKSIEDFSEQFLEDMKKRAELFPKPVQEKTSGYKKRDIVDVLSYVHEHYLDDNFSVKSMSAYFETSVSNLSHFFKKNMEVTISQYVEQIKLERAKEMLQSSDKKISEIAETLRYANSTAFIEMFKKYEGVTPGWYRENFHS